MCDSSCWSLDVVVDPTAFMPTVTNRSPQSAESFPCPHCGEAVIQGATFCRACGASEDSGWNDDDTADEFSSGYDDDEFDYEDFVSREFPQHASNRSPLQPKRLLLSLVIVLTCLAMLLLALGRH